MKWIAKENDELLIIMTNVKPIHRDINTQKLPDIYEIENEDNLILTDVGGIYTVEMDVTKKLSDIDDQLKIVNIKSAYDIMSKDVYDEMILVFGTTNIDSASAYEATWRLMKEQPLEFSSLGLTSRFSVAGLSLNDALDTEQKILDYSSAKLIDVLEYGKYRMQRIEQFRVERLAILG